MNHILFLTGTMVGGGAERVISVLANDFAKKGYEVTIVSIYGSGQDYKLDERIKLIPILCNGKVRFLRTLKRIRSIRKLVKAAAPDCVISFLAEVNVQALVALHGLHGIPIIVSERNDPQMNPGNVCVRRFRDRVYQWADGIVFQTPDAQQYFEHVKMKNRCLIVIPNPLTPNLPYRSFNPSNRRLIAACRLDRQKNLKMMIEAVADVLNKGIDCSLDIFGVGPQENELRELIDQLHMGDRIALRGFSSSIHQEMRNSAIYLISSDYEGISNSMIEALAIGLPVIATDCPIGGAKMFINSEENGILTPVNGRTQFAEAIIMLLQNPEKAQKIGERATRIRGELDVEAISQRWLEFISSTITSKEGRL